jgi:hypothetical protein
MRITFNKSMADILPRLNASAETPSSYNPKFGALLSDIVAEKDGQTELMGQLETSQIPQSSLSNKSAGPLASLNINKEGLLSPPLDRINELQIGSEEGVKTPTIVKAERRRMPAAYEGLSHESRAGEVHKLTSAYGFKYGVDPSLATAVAEVESAFNPTAVSKDGHASKGLFQLLDSTGQDLLEKTQLSQNYKPFNPEQNTELGVYYLRYLHDLFNEKSTLTRNRATVPAADSSSLEKLAVAAFNAGEGRVAQAQKKAQAAGLNGGDYAHVEPYLPETTQQYVLKVDSARARWVPTQDTIEGS